MPDTSQPGALLRTIGRALVWVLAVATTVHTVRLAHDLLVQPDGLPTWDAAGYLLDGVKYRELLLSGDVVGFLKFLTKPELHPPLHTLTLGLTMIVFGPDLSVVRAWPAAMFVLGLALLVWVGHAADRVRGRFFALGAVAISALSVEMLRYVASPMTEVTSIVATMFGLAAAVVLVPRRDGRAQLLVGIAMLVPALTRYNLPPMLLAPLYLNHAITHARDRRALLDPRVLLWSAPTAFVFAAWQLLRPDLTERISTFLENRSSGLEFWSAENLLWVPRTLSERYLATPWVAGPLLLLFLVGTLRIARDDLRGGADERSRLLHLFVWASFAALTWHDYKIDRSLYVVAPVFYLCALTTLGAIRLPGWVGSLGLAGFLAAWLPWQERTQLAGFADASDFPVEPIVRQSLEMIESYARQTDRLWVTGWFFRLSPNLIDYWLRSHGVKTRLKLDQLPLLGKSRTGIDAGWDEAYARWADEKMLGDPEAGTTTFITLETTPGTHFGDAWTAYGNNLARAMAEQTKIPEIDRLQFVDEGLLIRVYRAGGTPSDATLAAMFHEPRPEDDAGVELPAAAPIWRDTMQGKAPDWRLLPSSALSQVTLKRLDSAIEVTIPTALPSLQLCGPSPEVPTSFRGVVNLAVTNLTGKAWFHFRGLDEDLELQTVEGGDAPDISQIGPITGTGAGAAEHDVTLSSTSTRTRMCLILDGVSGTVRLDDVAIYPEAAPRLRPLALANPFAAPTSPPVTAAAGAPTEGVPAAPDVPAPTSGDDVGITLPKGTPLFRQTFAGADAGWRVAPADLAAQVEMAQEGGSARLTVRAPIAHGAWCGPSVPLPRRARAVLNYRIEDPAGKFWIHYRGLDGDGRLNTKAEGRPDLMQLLLKPGRNVLDTRLDLEPTSPQVRPCLVLDGITGTIVLEDLAFYAPTR